MSLSHRWPWSREPLLSKRYRCRAVACWLSCNGASARDHRQILEGILWVLRTGAPWRDLPQEFGPWHTYATRSYRWMQAGIWTRVLEELQRQSDATGMVEWSLHQADGSVIRAHQPAGTTPLGREGGVLTEGGSVRHALESRGRYPRSGAQIGHGKTAPSRTTQSIRRGG